MNFSWFNDRNAKKTPTEAMYINIMNNEAREKASKEINVVISVITTPTENETETLAADIAKAREIMT